MPITTDEELAAAMKVWEQVVRAKLTTRDKVIDWIHAPVWDGHMDGNKFAGIAKGVPMTGPCELPHYAWPGGYECFYITGDGSDLCWRCAQNVVDSNVEYATTGRGDDTFGMDAIIDYMDHAYLSETIVGWGSMDQTDSCVVCDDCGRFVEASGCEEQTQASVDGDSKNVLVHGEYCDWSNDAEQESAR